MMIGEVPIQLNPMRVNGADNPLKLFPEKKNWKKMVCFSQEIIMGQRRVIFTNVKRQEVSFVVEKTSRVFDCFLSFVYRNRIHTRTEINIPYILLRFVTLILY